MNGTQSARDEHATDLLDGLLSHHEITALLDEDPALADEVDLARAGRALLETLVPKPAPRDFLRKVQRRVRRRSGGRYFQRAAQPFGFRLSVEVFVVVAVVVTAACWFILDTGARPAIGPLVEEPVVEAPTAPSAP